MKPPNLRGSMRGTVFVLNLNTTGPAFQLCDTECKVICIYGF